MWLSLQWPFAQRPPYPQHSTIHWGVDCHVLWERKPESDTCEVPVPLGGREQGWRHAFGLHCSAVLSWSVGARPLLASLIFLTEMVVS